MFSEEVRSSILKRDNRECQFSKLFGISELSGEPCSQKLEVHHKTYKRETEEDGITVCKRCHDIITSAVRSLRYSRRPIELEDTKRIKLKVFKERNNENIELQDYRRNTPGNA